MTNLEAALSYLDKGLSVIPLWSPDLVRKSPPQKFKERLQKALAENDNIDDPLPKEAVILDLLTKQCKQPILPGWKKYQTELPTRQEVTQWFSEDPPPNVAILTGKLSKVVVFDVDSENGKQYADDEGGFPEDTVRVKTGKGVHVYVKHPGFLVKNQVDTGIGLDIRGDGGYAVAPPSRHASGREYEWEEGSSIYQIDPAPCREWMIDYLQQEGTKKKGSKSASKDPQATAPTTTSKKENEYLEILKNGCTQGERNHKATKLIGHWLKSHRNYSEVWEMVRIWNQGKNTPPMDESELKATFESIKKAEQRSEAPKLDVDAFLDKPSQIIKEYDENYLRIAFGGDTLSSLEHEMNGGLVGGRFYLIGGIPSSGKTVLLNNMADNICLNDHPVLVFSYDDGRSELRYRTFARFSGLTIEEFNKNIPPKQSIKNFCEHVDVKKILQLKYVVQNMIPTDKWEDLIDQIRKRHKKAPVIMIDYLRKLRTDNKISDERLRVDNIILGLTDLAKKHNIPIVAISELARDSYRSGQRLSMASFKESGTIEYEASWLGILAAVSEEADGRYVIKENWENIIQQDGIIDLIVYKAKRGTGKTGRVPLQIDKMNMTVMDRDYVDSPETNIRGPHSSKF